MGKSLQLRIFIFSICFLGCTCRCLHIRMRSRNAVMHLQRQTESGIENSQSALHSTKRSRVSRIMWRGLCVAQRFQLHNRRVCIGACVFIARACNIATLQGITGVCFYFARFVTTRSRARNPSLLHMKKKINKLCCTTKSFEVHDCDDRTCASLPTLPFLSHF